MTVSFEFDAKRSDRLDKLVSDAITELEAGHPLVGMTRSQVKSWVKAGLVSVDGRIVDKAAYVVAVGAQIKTDLSTLELARKTQMVMPQDLDVPILYADSDCVVFNKPAGMVVHPSAGHPDGTLMNALLHACPELMDSGLERPGIVHRLDKDTSGIIICAKHIRMHNALSEVFKSRAIEKSYLAICYGVPKKRSFDMHTLHARHPVDRLRFTTRGLEHKKEQPYVREARSSVQVLASHGGLSLLQVKIETGRTHQIRVQLSELGFPIVADELYGGRLSRYKHLPSRSKSLVSQMKRQALHAWQMSFTHPLTGEQLMLEAPNPSDFEMLKEYILAGNDA